MGQLKLTTRVLAFFLAAIAILLIVYSAAIYSIGREYIHNRFNEEMRATLSSLVAAVEVEETEVKWQPLEHLIAVSGSGDFGEIDWVVVGDKQMIVDRSSRALGEIRAPIDIAAEIRTNGIVEGSYDSKLKLQSLSERLTAPHPARVDREPDEFDEIVVFVSRSTVKRDELLARLILLVTVLPLIAWLLAAVPGYWLVKRAIKPVSEMAAQAETIGGTDFSTRLKVHDSGDELDGLAKIFNTVLDRQQVVIEQQRRFAGDAAHELRTPLTVLIGQIEVALRRPRSEPEYRSVLTNLRGQAGDLHEIVELLLFLARGETDPAVLGVRHVSVHAWLDEHQSSWASWTRAHDILLKNDVPAHIAVRATPSLLSRLIDNIVGNACKYSDAQTSVVVEASADGDSLIFEIRDSGVGISEQDLPHLFEPFFRTTTARLSGQAGNGLGLAIANKVAQLLGGSIRCVSQVGHGSCFTIRLPICP